MYHLSDKRKAERILTQIRSMDGVKKIEISEDLTELDIETEPDRLSSVMDRVVNICRKVSLGCEVSYKFT